MAILYPIKLDGNRFFVNPTNIRVTKRSQIAETRTMGGTVFKIWPDMPDEILFNGVCFGMTSLMELKYLGGAISRDSGNKLITLSYKFKNYKGYMRDLVVKAVANEPRVFNYEFGFVLNSNGSGRFNIADMPLGQLTGLQEEYNLLMSQMRGAVTTVTSIPGELVDGVKSVAKGIGNIGVNIGRPSRNV